LQTCHFLNYSAAGRRLLTRYIQRTGWLCEGLADTLSPGALQRIGTAETDALVFVHLPDPTDRDLLTPAVVAALREQRAVILTSPYPARLFEPLPFPYLAFLPEPFSFEQFATCLEIYISLYE
jgi:hypothetical protein